MKFTSEELRELAAIASTIWERINGGFVPLNSEPSAAARERLRRWMQIATLGRRNAFRSILATLGHTEETILPLLGSVSLPRAASAPSWTNTLDWIMLSLGKNLSTRSIVEVDLNGRLGTDELPFGSFLYPLVIETRLRRDVLLHPNVFDVFSSSALEELDRGLLKRLCSIMGPVLFERYTLYSFLDHGIMFNVSVVEGSYDSQVLYAKYLSMLQQGGFLDVIKQRPIIGRILASIVDQWISSTSVMINRTCNDFSLLTSTYSPNREIGLVSKLTSEQSDRHRNGHSVCILEWSGGTCLVYKPRDLSVDIAWTSLLLNLEQMGAMPLPGTVQVLARDGYGWHGFVPPSSLQEETDASKFYRRAGSLLALLYFTQATDFHSDNVIACGAYPTPVDLETLVHPHAFSDIPESSGVDAYYSALREIKNSVLATLYLPVWIADLSDNVYGIGGLNVAAMASRGRWELDHGGSYGMQYCLVNDDSKPSPMNLPRFEGRPISPGEHSEAIVDGFGEMADFILKHAEALSLSNGPLSAFASRSVRVVLAPTQIYALILKRSQEPDCLSNGIDWSMQFYWLYRLNDYSSDASTNSKIRAAEFVALSKQDIPIFYSNTSSRDLIMEDGSSIADFFERPSIEQVTDRLCATTQYDIERQCDYIRASVPKTTRHEYQSESTSFTKPPLWKSGSLIVYPSQYVKEAERIGKWIERTGIHSSDDVVWIGSSPIGHDFAQVSPVGLDLYSGSCGIGLFLAALFAVTKDMRYRKLALRTFRRTVQIMSDQQRAHRWAEQCGIGGAAGMGSIVYSLAQAAILIEEPSLSSTARETSHLIRDHIENDGRLDVVSGSAGAILGLLALYNVAEDESVLEVAITCGAHLMQAMTKTSNGQYAWATVGTQHLSGFSHGAAGISLALLRLYSASGEIQFFEGAMQGIEYERSLYRTKGFICEKRRMPENNSGFACQWCYGATGIGLARLSSLEVVLSDPALSQEVEAAVEATLESGMSPKDSLCCGNLGKIDFIFRVGKTQGRLDYIRLAQFALSNVITRSRQAGEYGWLWGSDRLNPGLFSGLSGVGYQLLRLHNPDVVPSVLTWESTQQLSSPKSDVLG